MRIGYIAISSLLLTACLHQREAREGQRNSNNVEIIVDESDGKEKPVETPVYKPSSSAILNKYATQLKVDPAKLYNAKLYEEIDGWIGVKYKWAGNDKNGVDCSGFAGAVYKAVYGHQLKRSGYDIVKDCEEISKDELLEGDLVFFDISSKNSHVGIYLANHKFVHASTSKGVIVSDLNEAYWTKYWGRGGRIK